MTRRAPWTVLPWTTVVPIVAVLALAAAWGRHPDDAVLGVLSLLLVGAVLAAVHHAEVVAHRVGSRSARWCSRSRSPSSRWR